MKLITTLDTYLKPSSADSTTLPPEELAYVSAGMEFPVKAYRQWSNHIHFTVDPERYDLKALHPSAKNTWWVWEGAVEDPEGFSKANNPMDAGLNLKVRDRGVAFTLPGYTQTFYSGEPICTESPNFTWAEALHFGANSFRRPTDAAVVKNIIRSAQAMQEVRAKLGSRAITINSWYRDPATNRRVGGASQSRHMAGDGVDFRVDGIAPHQVYAALNVWWGNRGGLASSSAFTHLDCRGYRARWSYGF